MSQDSELRDLETVGEVVAIPIYKIRPYANQPRKRFPEESLLELAGSIKANGQKTPVVVRRVTDAAPPIEFEFIGGERRWKACQLGDIPFLNCIIREVLSEKEQYVDAITDNVGREPLSDVENIEACRKMKFEFEMSVEEIAQASCQGIVWVYRHLRVAEHIHSDVIKLMDEDRPERSRISFGNAVRMVNLTHDDQKDVANTIINKGLRGREALTLIENRIANSGIRFRSESHTPRKKLEKVVNAVDSSYRNLNSLAERKTSYYEELFNNRPPQDRREVINKLQQIRQKAEALQTMLVNLTLNQ